MTIPHWMRRCLDLMVVEGIKTNIPLHREILEDETFQAGEYTTDYLPALVKRLKKKAKS